MFLVLEGLDGAGTTTQTHRLGDRLRATGYKVVLTGEPTHGPIGRIIREALSAQPGAPDMRIFPWLFAADRADHLLRTVEPALACGAVVVSDRYLHSSLAYQSLSFPLSEVAVLNSTFRLPDLTVFLSVPAAVCQARVEARLSGGQSREIYENLEYLTAIEECYHTVLDLQRSRGEHVVLLDGTQSADAVEDAVWNEVNSLIQTLELKPRTNQ